LPRPLIRNVAILANIAMGASCALASAAAAQGSSVVIQVNGVPSSKGVVRADVCTLDTFLKANCPYSGVAPAVRGQTIVTVDNVPPGVYAVQVFHDRNNNGRLDRGVLGIPKESLGFSNDAPLGLHGPRFGRAAFIHGEDSHDIIINLRHFGPGYPPPEPTQETVE
jgi:uncharacterized protein (DUF2141 family)